MHFSLCKKLLLVLITGAFQLQCAMVFLCYNVPIYLAIPLSRSVRLVQMFKGKYIHILKP